MSPPHLRLLQWRLMHRCTGLHLTLRLSNNPQGIFFLILLKDPIASILLKGPPYHNLDVSRHDIGGKYPRVANYICLHRCSFYWGDYLTSVLTLVSEWYGNNCHLA